MDDVDGTVAGEDTQDTQPEAEQTPEAPQVSDALKAFAKSQGVSTDDPAALLEAVWKSRGDEIKGRQTERKSRQSLESQLSSLALDKVLGSTEITDESRAQLQALAHKANQLDQIGAALDKLVEKGGLTKEVLTAVAAGPAAIEAAFAMAGGATQTAGNDEAIAKRVAAIIDPTIGVGADIGQQKPANTKKEPESVLAKLGMKKGQGLTENAGKFVDMLKTPAGQRGTAPKPTDK